MAESGGCCKCCCTFISTLGLAAFFMWLSLRTSNPKCSIEYFYLPALNNSLNSYQPSTTTTTPSNITLYFLLKLTNPNKNKGIYYDAINLTFSYRPPNITTNTTTPAAVHGGENYQAIGVKTISGFHQGHDKKAKRKDSVDPRGVDWAGAFRAVLNNRTVVFRVDLATKVRFKIIFWKTKKQRINVGANVEVNDKGTKVNKKGIKLKSGTPKLGWYRAPVVVALVISFYILNFSY